MRSLPNPPEETRSRLPRATGRHAGILPPTMNGLCGSQIQSRPLKSLKNAFGVILAGPVQVTY